MKKVFDEAKFRAANRGANEAWITWMINTVRGLYYFPQGVNVVMCGRIPVAREWCNRVNW